MNFHKSCTRPIIQSPLKFSNNLPRRQKVVVNRLNFVMVSTFFIFFFFFFFGIVRISNFSWNYNLAANDKENRERIRRINRKSDARWQTSILVWTKELLCKKRKKYFRPFYFSFILCHFKYYVFLSWRKID